MKTKILSFLFIAAMIAGCSKDAIQEGEMAIKFKNSAIEICGEPEVFTLWGGQTIDVGTVTVANNEENLYVTYATSGDWWLTEVHLYVLDEEPTSRLIPGHAPYKEEFDPYVKTYTITVPLADLGFEITCDETVLWLQAHAAVVKLDELGEEIDEETAYGGDITKPARGSWYGNIKYIVQCCEDEEEPCYEFEDETAWADGIRYENPGNWATYTVYVADATVILYAGQNINIGTVHFSAPDNEYITITITLNDIGGFQDKDENVKIQDYATAPSGNPAPGGFAHKGKATGKSFSIIVPLNDYYGVHVDAGYWKEVPCEEE